MFNYKDWLVAESLLGDETWLYYRGTQWPHFMGRIYDEDDAPVEGLTLSLTNGQIMAEIQWFGESEPTEPQLIEICGHAGKALEAYDGMLDADINMGEIDDED